MIKVTLRRAFYKVALSFAFPHYISVTHGNHKPPSLTPEHLHATLTCGKNLSHFDTSALSLSLSHSLAHRCTHSLSLSISCAETRKHTHSDPHSLSLSQTHTQVHAVSISQTHTRTKSQKGLQKQSAFLFSNKTFESKQSFKLLNDCCCCFFCPFKTVSRVFLVNKNKWKSYEL